MNRRTISAVATIAAVIAACGGPTGKDQDGTTSEAELSSGAATKSVTTGISGVVTEARTGAPIEGVVVGDGTRTATTSASGAYRLAERAGTYTLTAKKSGYLGQSQVVTVPSKGLVTVDWKLAPASAATAPSGAAFKVFANNDLGMHCVDKSFDVFSILPPYNVVDAQVVSLRSDGPPVLVDATQVDVRYGAVADATGSINSTSLGKSNFWRYAPQLYGVSLADGQGLQGMWMPADAPTAAGTTLVWDGELGLFKAPGIPIFPIDDGGKVNRYPLMRFSAFDKAGNPLGASDVVLPVSEETSCQLCHATGKAAARSGVATWSTAADLEQQARENVLLLHNAKSGTKLQAPVLCASCHYSPALDLAGTGPSIEQSKHGTMSSAMHRFHADKMGGLVDAPVAPGGTVPAAATQSCYACHPGASTQCLRGAMTSALDCQNCHGDMAAVGGAVALRAGGSIDGKNDGGARRPWLDLPRCGSCHASDAVTKTPAPTDVAVAADGLRFTTAFATGDASASPLVAANPRFTEEAGKLYRKSKGHGGLACEACHGSTHAIWSSADSGNDAVAPSALQGHAGTVAECSTCHLAAPTSGLGGPHGMHPVGAAWVKDHGNFAESQLAACRACHGADDRGTVLSRMFTTRTLAGRTLTAGKAVGCYDCHNGPRT